MFLSGMLARGRTRDKTGPPLRLARLARWLPALVWMGGIFWLSQQSKPLGQAASGVEAVVAHLGLYAGLGLLLVWALALDGSRRGAGGEEPAWVLASLAFNLTVLYGVLDELHQAFVPGRTASEADLGLDAVGALIGVGLALLLPRLAKAQRRSR